MSEEEQASLSNLISKETSKRRTFAIISHPDAGKTTLTEKLLLYAGMLRTAGMVRGRKADKHASSDWMGMEQERGISISASAMSYEYNGCIINVLDTPGHQDFSEDTYRTLTAADCALMVIDATVGVQEQTIKLFKVCGLRGIPIMTFINKMDLPCREPYDLIEELEKILELNCSPINWPIGLGKEFCGVAELESSKVTIFERSSLRGSQKADSSISSISEASIPEDLKETLNYDLELLLEAGNAFDREEFLAGNISPVFFGSALTNFGVEPFYEAFINFAPPPRARKARDSEKKEISVLPGTDDFSAYVFKIQANLDPKHRDSMAYLRVCSGRFERDMTVFHVPSKSNIRMSRSHAMFGGGRSTLDYAYPGDIIGVVNPGVFSIGDTVMSAEGNKVKSGDYFSFLPMPTFPPEVVAELRPKDVMKRKAFDKAVKQLSSEGAVLVLNRCKDINSEPLIAAVGKLQFDVLQYRIKNEYNVDTVINNLPYSHGAWLEGEWQSFRPPSNSLLAKTLDERVVLLYASDWQKNFAAEENPNHELRGFLDDVSA